MTTKLRKKPRIPLPEDIQPGDVLVHEHGHPFPPVQEAKS